jgi:H+-transporting ATPase
MPVMTQDARGRQHVTPRDHNTQNPNLPPTGPDGLTSEEARQRLAHYGPNEIAERHVSPLLKLLAYFWGPIAWMIEIAAGLSAIVQHWTDFAIIMVLLVANAVVGFWEEYQAGNAIDALKKNLAVRAKVKRNGKWLELAARELVPGDLIRLRIGGVIPADAQLKEGDPVDVDQSALTGESLPVSKKPGEIAYSGSILKRGEIDAVVTGTGKHTFFGRTAELVAAAQPKSHFQQAVLNIGNYLIVLALTLAAAIVLVSILRGESGLTTVRFALVLTVAAIPVAMPTVLSVTMAVGARLLAKQQAVVRKLPAVEEIAGIDVLCSDKTGTLTQNKLKLGEPFTVAGVSADRVVLDAALASREEDQDPIDLAVLQGVKDPQELQRYRITHFAPFDPVHKRTEADVTGPDGESFKVAKGAPQVILALSSNKDQVAQAANHAIEEFAVRGFRSLGVARRDGGQWRFMGILPLFDPPREDSAATIQAAEQMGLLVKMVTGDQVAIAREIAGRIGLGRNIMDAQVFGDGEQGPAPTQRREKDAALEKAVQEADGFAQVFPEHKYRIVKLLQAKGHLVGMTGDGVNDAPALRQADAGIAVSGATDAARAAASIVLMAPGLSVIVDAIKQSRVIFQRMNSYAIYRITETLRVLFFIAATILAFNFYPVTAVMIVLLAILNDGAILSIAFDNAHWGRKPEVWQMSTVLALATALGTMGVAETFGLFYLATSTFGLDHVFLQSLIYLKLSVSGHLTIFVTRTHGPFWSERPSWILLVAVIGTQCLATFIVVYGFLMPAIGWGWAGFVWGYALVMFLVEDRVKLLVYRIQDTYRRRRRMRFQPSPPPATDAG